MAQRVHTPTRLLTAEHLYSITDVFYKFELDAGRLRVMEPPGFQLHLWAEGRGLVTHTAVLGEFDGPHPFYDADGRLID